MTNIKCYLNYFQIVVFLAVSPGIIGQLNFKNGLIITHNNDTINGLIHDGGNKRNSNVCVFKANKKSETLKYYSGDIKAYRFNDDKFYCTKKIYFKGDSNNVFTEVLLKGKINLYYSSKNKDIQYFIEKEDEQAIGLINRKKTNNSTNVILSYTQNTSIYDAVFKDTLSSFFRDSKKIYTQVGNVNYNHKSLINITKAYLHENCKRTDCVSYEKDLTSMKPRFGVYTGLQISKLIWEPSLKSDLSFSIPLAVFLNVPLTRINDRLSLQLELLSRKINYMQHFSDSYFRYNTIQINYRTIGFPLLIKYKLYESKLAPSIGVGWEIGYPIGSKIVYNNITLAQPLFLKGGLFFEIGINYKPDKLHTLFSNIRFQSNSDMVIGSNNNAYHLPYFSASMNRSYNFYKIQFAALHLGIKF